MIWPGFPVPPAFWKKKPFEKRPHGRQGAVGGAKTRFNRRLVFLSIAYFQAAHVSWRHLALICCAGKQLTAIWKGIYCCRMGLLFVFVLLTNCTHLRGLGRSISWLASVMQSGLSAPAKCATPTRSVSQLWRAGIVLSRSLALPQNNFPQSVVTFLIVLTLHFVVALQEGNKN